MATEKEEKSVGIKERVARIPSLGPLIGLVVLFIALGAISPDFLTVSNILNVLRQVSINAIIAFGMTFVILTGGIDLSVGSILALSGAVSAGLMANGTGTVPAVLAGLGLGALSGLFNGLLITKGKMIPFIATLGTLTIFRGLTLVYTEGIPITGLSESFAMLGQGYFLQIPTPIVWMLVTFIILWVVLRNTTLGRRVYAVGSNEEATWLSGINTDRVKLFVYGVSGFLSAFSGLILTSRLNSAQPTAGTAFELDAIAAVVLGGTSLAGGRGLIWGTLIGALIIGFLNNGLNLLNVSSFYQQVARGAVILLAVLVDRPKSRT